MSITEALTMSSDVADIMEALGKPEAAATLRWGQRQYRYDELAEELESTARELESVRGELDDIAKERVNEKQTLASIRTLAGSLDTLIEAVSAETPHDDCGECAITRLVVAVDELRRMVKEY